MSGEEENDDFNVLNDNSTLSDYQITLPERIEVVIKALGTMIIEPQYETNDITFKKEQVGAVQHPILEGNKRDKVLNVLVELINQL